MIPYRSLLGSFLMFSACFSDAPQSASTTADGSSTSVGGSSTSASSSSAESTPADSSSSDTASHTTGECSDLAFDDRRVESFPVDLIVLALPGIPPAFFNDAVTSRDFAALAVQEDLRIVVIDPTAGVDPAAGVEGLPGSCESCPDKACTTAVHLEVDVDAAFATLFNNPASYDCVFHPRADEARRRLLVLSPAPELEASDQAALEALIYIGWDVDLACPGCSDASADFAQTVTAAGGLVSDLDDSESAGIALFVAAARPPHCSWAINDSIEAPFTLADLRVTIDACEEDKPCPQDVAQVSGIGTCDADDPSASEFTVLVDAVGAGTSLASLCPPACFRQRRFVSAFYSVTHTYACPN